LLALLGLAGRAYGARTPIRGAHRGDESGTAIAGAGDVNGDGRSDALISTPGSVYVVFGRRKPGMIRLGRLGKGGFRIVGSRDLGSFDGAVAGVGDVNGDRLADVLVSDGSHGYVVFGKRNRATVDLAQLGAGGYELEGDIVGVAGAGDVNGDGRPDFLVQTVDTGGAGGPPGAARVVFGYPPGDPVVDGVPTGFDLVSHDDSDFTGAALAGAGDLNGDGLADVIIGAPNGGTGVIGNDGPEGDFSGRVYVVYGKRDGAPVDLQNLADQGFTILRSASGEDGGLVGASVAGVGDVNRDGRPDLVQSGNQSDATVIFGGHRSGTLDTRQLGSAGVLIRRSRAQGIISVTGLGDASGDRVPDIGLGTESEGISPRYGGAAYRACGGSGLRSPSLRHPSACLHPVGQEDGKGNGWQAAGVGDFNGDGLGDMLVSDATPYLAPGHSRGTSYMIYGTRR